MNKSKSKNIGIFESLRFVFFTLLFFFLNSTIFSEDRKNKIEFIGLSMFSAEYTSGEVLLAWETITEVNIYGYEVVRGDSLNNWQTLGFIPGSGNSNSLKSYSFIDSEPQIHDCMYFLKQINADGYYSYSDTISASITTGVVDDILNNFELFQNYPNPFNPTTEIAYSLPKGSNVTLKIYNAIGQEVAVLINERQEAGMFTVTFNASSASGGLPSGIYFYSIRTAENASVKKMMLLK